jgi:hypothetical protein
MTKDQAGPETRRKKVCRFCPVSSLEGDGDERSTGDTDDRAS